MQVGARLSDGGRADLREVYLKVRHVCACMYSITSSFRVASLVEVVSDPF